jgi:hypothetical protein
MTRRRRLCRQWAKVLGTVLLAVSGLGVRSALAWDPATTHRGLTERAVSASTLHTTLVERLGRPLGGYEPLRLDTSVLAPDLARSLKQRLACLDPAAGASPSPDGLADAFAWVWAGAILEKTPPERGRHHFFEPGTRTGLDDGPGLSGEVYAARLTFDDGASVREAATGQAFALTGMPALDWVWSTRNELGLQAFFDNWERATSAPEAKERETALVRALLALGGTLAVLEDMGQPAFVRNDFRGEFLWDEGGSQLERLAADRYGAVAVPAPAASVVRPDIDSYFVAEDGKGLAQMTQRRFFSPGTLPRDLRVDSEEKPADVVRAANQTLAFPAPALTTLDLGHPDHTRYVKLDGARVLAYERNANRVRFFLDHAVYADCTSRWLPIVGGYAAGLVDHLMRVHVAASVADGRAEIAVAGITGKLAPGAKLHVLAEDGEGRRKEIGQATPAPATKATFDLPAGTRKVAAYVRGSDAGGAFVAAAESTVP